MAEAALGMRAVQRQVELNAREADRWNAANPDLPSRQPAPVLSADYSGLHAAAQDQLAAARRLLRDACDVRDTAAQRAAARVDDAAHDDLENTVLSWAGRGARHVGGWVTELPGFDEVTTRAGTVATVAGLAALALAWVPVIGQALAVIAVGAGVIALAGNLAKLAAGTGSWRSVALDALSLATMGVGRAAAVAARGSRAAAEASLRGAHAARTHQALWLSTTKGGPTTPAPGRVAGGPPGQACGVPVAAGAVRGGRAGGCAAGRGHRGEQRTGAGLSAEAQRSPRGSRSAAALGGSHHLGRVGYGRRCPAVAADLGQAEPGRARAGRHPLARPDPPCRHARAPRAQLRHDVLRDGCRRRGRGKRLGPVQAGARARAGSQRSGARGAGTTVRARAPRQAAVVCAP